MQGDVLPSSRTFQRPDHRGPRQPAGLVQIVEAFDGECDGAKAGFTGLLGDVHIGQRAGAAKIQALLGAVHDHQAEISQETFDHPKVGMTVEHMVDVFDLQHGSCSWAFKGQDNRWSKPGQPGSLPTVVTVGRLYCAHEN